MKAMCQEKSAGKQGFARYVERKGRWLLFKPTLKATTSLDSPMIAPYVEALKIIEMH